eukprot:scaffold239133_cov24-Prasinocladus_malaysianus.AAC.1
MANNGFVPPHFTAATVHHHGAKLAEPHNHQKYVAIRQSHEYHSRQIGVVMQPVTFSSLQPPPIAGRQQTHIIQYPTAGTLL